MFFDEVRVQIILKEKITGLGTVLELKQCLCGLKLLCLVQNEG
jgi:hypothetical protein